MLSVWLALTSEEFFFPVLWLWGHFQWVCFIPISSFSFPSFHVFVRIDDSCLLALPLSCFLPFILFFFVLPYILLFAVLSPPFSVLSLSDSYYCPSGLLVFFLTHLSFVWRTINNPSAIMYDQLTVSWCLHFLIGFNLHCLLVIHIPKWLEAKYGSYVCVYPSPLTHLAPENHACCLKFQYVPVHFFIMPQ